MYSAARNAKAIARINFRHKKNILSINLSMKAFHVNENVKTYDDLEIYVQERDKEILRLLKRLRDSEATSRSNLEELQGEVRNDDLIKYKDDLDFVAEESQRKDDAIKFNHAIYILETDHIEEERSYVFKVIDELEKQKQIACDA